MRSLDTNINSLKFCSTSNAAAEQNEWEEEEEEQGTNQPLKVQKLLRLTLFAPITSLIISERDLIPMKCSSREIHHHLHPTLDLKEEEEEGANLKLAFIP